MQANLRRAEHIIAAMERGVVVLGVDMRITWVNGPFRTWCAVDPIGKTLLEALGNVTLVWPEMFPMDGLLLGRTASLRLLHRGNIYLDVTVTPVREGDRVVELIAICA